MLFTGHSEHSIDAKQRLAIPAKYRNQWDESRDGKAWFCVPWPNGSLRLYTERTFTRLAAEQEPSLTQTADEADLLADFFGLAERLEMDKQGRVAIPRRHIDMTGLPTEVVVIGAMNRLEVRDRAAWLESQNERFARLPTLVERIESKRK